MTEKAGFGNVTSISYGAVFAGPAVRDGQSLWHHRWVRPTVKTMDTPMFLLLSTPCLHLNQPKIKQNS